MSTPLGIEAARRLQRAERRWLEQCATRLHRAAQDPRRRTARKEADR